MKMKYKMLSLWYDVRIFGWCLSSILLRVLILIAFSLMAINLAILIWQFYLLFFT